MKASSSAADAANKAAERPAASPPLKQLEMAIETPAVEELTNMSVDEMLTEKNPLEPEEQESTQESKIEMTFPGGVLREVLDDLCAIEQKIAKTKTWIMDALAMNGHSMSEHKNMIDRVAYIRQKHDDNLLGRRFDKSTLLWIEYILRGGSEMIADNPEALAEVKAFLNQKFDVAGEGGANGSATPNPPVNTPAGSKPEGKQAMAGGASNSIQNSNPNFLASVKGIPPVALAILMHNGIGTVEEYLALPNAKHPSKGLLKSKTGKAFTDTRIKKVEEAIHEHLQNQPAVATPVFNAVVAAATGGDPAKIEQLQEFVGKQLEEVFEL